MKKEEAEVIIIGAGPAGLQVARVLISMGKSVLIIEKESRPGGKLLLWDSLFPNGNDPMEILSRLTKDCHMCIRTSTEVIHHNWYNGVHYLVTACGRSFMGKTLVFATGFRPFDATLKEEYGYGIYKNVITSVDLEKMFSRGEVRTSRGDPPERMAMVHCVGSRDLKSGNEYCSSVCCITGIKQSIRLSQLYPGIRVSHLYIDLRLGGRFYEYCYKEAQMKYHISFIRGRLSETNPGQEDTLVIRYEDTLAGRPARMTVDMLVLLIGMVPQPLECFRKHVIKAADGFLGKDSFEPFTHSFPSSVFYAGACTGPKNLEQSINEGTTVAWEVNNYLEKIYEYKAKYHTNGIHN